MGSGGRRRPGRRRWLDWGTIVIAGVAVGVVIMMALALEEHGAGGPATNDPTLQEFEHLNPTLRVRQEHVTDPNGQPGRQLQGSVLLHLEDPARGARATLREDFVLGHPVRLEPCPPSLPAAPGLLEAQCVQALAVGDRPAVAWLSARLDREPDGSDVAYQRAYGFYARADEESTEGRLVVHRLSDDRIAVGLMPREEP